jgi:hypothetical protein
MAGIVIACKRCAALLTRELTPWTREDWEREAYRVMTNASPLVDEAHVLRWSNELWNEDSMFLPFATDSWVVAPEAVIGTPAVTTPPGCCGHPPIWNATGRASMNQLCVCGELVGWHNTDCLMPEYVAFASDDVEAMPA